MAGFQDRLLIAGRKRLECGILLTDIVEQPAIIQNFSIDQRRRKAEQRVGFKELSNFVGIDADVAVDRQSRIEIRFRNADECALSGKISLCLPHIRSASQQLSGNPRFNDWRRKWYWLLNKTGGQLLGGRA